MSRPATFPPKLHAHRGRARVKWSGKWWDCGRDGTDEARRKYRKLLALWIEDPAAGLDRDEYLVSRLCADYALAAPFAPGEKVQVKRALTLLVDLHAETPVSEFGPLALGAWLRTLADKRRPDGEPYYTRGYLAKLLRIVVAVWTWGIGRETVQPAWRDALAALVVAWFSRRRELATEPVREDGR